jgi:hypothetical protein
LFVQTALPFTEAAYRPAKSVPKPIFAKKAFREVFKSVHEPHKKCSRMNTFYAVLQVYFFLGNL